MLYQDKLGKLKGKMTLYTVDIFPNSYLLATNKLHTNLLTKYNGFHPDYYPSTYYSRTEG